MGRRRKRAAGAGGVLTLSLALLSGGRAESAELLLPGVARADGAAGSRFESVVWLHNPSAAGLDVELSAVTASGPSHAALLRLGPHETLRLPDPLGGLLGIGSGAGTLRARSDGPLLLRGVTANVADPRGAYGLALSALAAGEALLPGETGTAAWLAHTEAAGVDHRSNVAVTLLEGGTEVLVRLLDDTGLVRGEERVRSDTPLFWQRSVGVLAADPEIPVGRVEVRVLSGAAVAYAAVVDNVTGDGLLAPARRDATPGGGAYAALLAGAARASGRNGTLWRTELRLVNAGLAPASVTLEAAGVPNRSAVRVVPPRGVLQVVDLLGALGQPEGSAGPVRVRAAAPLLALASTKNLHPGGLPGTFAASQELTAVSRLAGAGALLVLPGLASETAATGVRTNVALIGGPAGAAGRLRLRGPAGGSVAEGAYALGPWEWAQRALPEWLSGAAVPADATLELLVETGALDAYASVIDNGTGDPVILAPAPVPSAACPAGRAPARLVASASRVEAGAPVTLRLEAAGRGAGRVEPGGAPLAPGGSVVVVPAVTTTWRWAADLDCPGDAGAATVEVVAPAGAVMTESGAVSGAPSGGSVSFRGIPFAASPAGALRWRPPAPPAAWTGVRSAVAFGPVCPQLDDGGRVTGAEGCLALNVWAPATPPDRPLPVLFFVHGGGNAQGAGSMAIYDGTAFASMGRAVVVTANYRLGPFGWLVQPFLSAESRRGVSGNYGLFDQLEALRWVRRNVAAFGGDPSRVTVFGESAGGVNVCALVASPLASGLLAGGVMQSGGCTQKSLAEFEAFGETVTAKAGCPDAADPSACLRALPFESVLLAVPPAVSVVSSTGQLWGPAVDGFALRASPDVVLARGEQNEVPFVVGANADETGQAAPPIATEAEYRAAVALQFGALAPLVLARYPASAFESPRKAYVAVTTDARFVCPARRIARAAASGGGARVFRYLFAYPANRLFGAIHGVELPFVFGSFSAIPGYTPSAEALALSDAMNAAWARFAATGDPNGPGLPAWPAYDAARDRTLLWDAHASAADGVRTAACDFWDALLGAAAR